MHDALSPTVGLHGIFSLYREGAGKRFAKYRIIVAANPFFL